MFQGTDSYWMRGQPAKFEARRRRLVLVSGTAVLLATLGSGGSAAAQAVAAVTAAAPAAVTSPAAGPSTAADGATGIAPVIVTARRRAEDLEKVPVAVSDFTPVQIQNYHIDRLANLDQFTPSLNFVSTGFDPISSYIAIRGQTTTNLSLNLTPAIGIYVDDVYEESTGAAGLNDLFDTSDVEVLKGPQGTLYGRNTTGGAIKVETNRPDYSGFYGTARIGFGNFSQNDQAVMLNVPLVDHKLALRVVAQRHDVDGFATDAVHNSRLGGVDGYSIHLALRFDPTDKLDILARASWNDATAGGNDTQLTYVAPGINAATLSAGFQILAGGNIANSATLYHAAAAQAGMGNFGPLLNGAAIGYAALNKLVANRFSDTVFLSERESDYTRTGAASVIVSYDLSDNLNLKSISAWRYLQSSADADTDGSPYVILDGIAGQQRANQYTEELQLNGSALDKKLKYTAGYFFYYQRGLEGYPGEEEVPTLSPVDPATDFETVTTTSHSVYAQASYAVLDNVNLTGGLRWTTESQDFNQTHNTFGPFCNIPVAFQNTGPCMADAKTSSSAVSYTFGADWTIKEGAMVYAKTSRGYKAGGINNNPQADFPAFKPEFVTDYEVGLKTEFWDHRLRINADYYHSSYTDIQRQVFVLANGAVTSLIANAARANIDGAELEVTAVPIPRLTLSAVGSYTFPKYQNYIDPATHADLSGNPFYNTPKFEGNISANYVWPVQFGDVSATVDYSYRTKVYFNPDAETPATRANLSDGQAGYGLLNANLALNIPDRHLQLSLWARNLLDKRYVSGGLDLSSSLGYVISNVQPPRTFGGQVTYKF
jgi:iron complex outermembrane receptor protein